MRSSLGNKHGASAMVHEAIHVVGIRGRARSGLAGEVRSWTAQGYFEMSIGLNGSASRMLNRGGIQEVARYVRKVYGHK